MENENPENSCCTDGVCSCRVEAILSVDERGQMVLPKEVRARFGLRPSDKMALISWERDGRICCLSMIRADELTEMVKDRLGPLLGDMLREKKEVRG